MGKMDRLCRRRHSSVRCSLLEASLGRVTRVIVCALIGLSLANAARAGAPKFIDTQAQFDPGDRDYRGALLTMLHEMDRVGISMTLIVPPPFPYHRPVAYDAEAILRTIDHRVDRFAFLGGGGSLNGMIMHYRPAEVTPRVKAEFRKRCEQIMTLGALGFGEVTASHLSLPGMGEHHPYISAAPDHPLLLLLADIAAEKDVPIDIHFDLFPRTIQTPTWLRHGNPSVLKENQVAFERLLAHNSKARFNWAHIGSDPGGQRTVALMTGLLSRHPNLYSAFRLPSVGKRPVQPLNPAGILKPEWRALIERFPNRFTMHTDIFYGASWPPKRGPHNSHELAIKLLEQLPPDLARKLAYENAQRIYKIAE